MAKIIAVAADGYAPEGNSGDNGFSHYETVWSAEDIFGDIDPDVEITNINVQEDKIEILATVPARDTSGEVYGVEYRRGVAIVNSYGVIKAWVAPTAEYENSPMLYKRRHEIEFFGAARFDSLETAAEWVKWAVRALK